MALYNGDLPTLGPVTTGDEVKLLGHILRLLRTTGDLAKVLGSLLENTVAGDDADPDLTRKILALGASANAQSSNGDSMLHLAAGAGSWESVRALIGYGAKVDATGKGGYTALHIAAKHNQVANIEEFLQAGAENRADINAPDEGGRTPLHVATVYDNAASVALLHARGADLNRPDDFGHTPVYLGVVTALCQDARYALDALLDAGADVNVRAFDDDNNASSSSPLDLATGKGNLVVMGKLLTHNANVNSKTREGHTALHMATLKDLDGAMNLLVGAGANVNAEAEHGFTPLHYAAAGLLMGPARALLDHRASVNTMDAQGRSPLHLAVESNKSEGGNCAEMVDFLLKRGADEKAKDGDGYTPAQVMVWLSEQQRLIDEEALRLLVYASKDRADRAWARRGSLVKCRARLLREQAELRDRACGASCRASDGEARSGKRAKLTNVEEGGGGADEAGDNGSREIADREAAERASVGDDCVEGAVKKVAGMGDESVFRHVAMFL